MADINLNFSCSDPGLSRTNVTSEAWMILSEGSLHENSVLAVAVCQTLFIAVGIPWNIIVLAFIIVKKHYKEPTYILLANLVLADSLVCSCLLPFNTVSAYSTEFSIGDSDYVRCQVCHTIIILMVSLIFVSFFTLAIMSVDRLIYIKWPIKYSNNITTCKTLFILLGVWVFCILISLPPVFGFGEIKFANVLSSCSLIVAGETHVSANIYYVMFLAFLGFFPFMTTVSINILLLAIVCKNVQRRHVKSLVSNYSSRKDLEILRKNSEIKLKADFHKRQILLAKVFGALFIANVVTWVPSLFFAVVSARSDQVSTPAFAFVYLAYTCQPAIHPVLETCLIGKAKETLFEFICFCRRRTKLKRTQNSNVISI